MMVFHTYSLPIKDIFKQYIDSLAQDCSNSIANALELPQSCARPSIYPVMMCLIYTLVLHLPVIIHAGYLLSFNPNLSVLWKRLIIVSDLPELNILEW